MQPFTIIIPTYNRSSFLEQTLRSLTYQTRQDFHVILIDHGSQDNTKSIFEHYQQRLSVEYHYMVRSGYPNPGIPRDLGIRYATSPLIAFLDAGMIVPPFYVASHCTFHEANPHSVGIGLQHVASENLLLTSEQLVSLMTQLEHPENSEANIFPYLQHYDIRKDRIQKSSPFVWSFGWTANLSLPLVAYQEVGGFDLGFEGWGFEDLDLSYRLWKRCYQMACVHEGWGIELPHPRASGDEREQTEHRNMLYAYKKQRSLALEALIYAKWSLKNIEETFRYLTALGHRYTTPAIFPDGLRAQWSRPSLLIGYTTQEIGDFDYRAVANEDVVSTSSVWSASGVLIPLPDHSLATVIVSDIWKHLYWSCHDSTASDSISLLECLIAELQRTTQKVWFFDTPSVAQERDLPYASTTLLTHLCEKYHLSFQIITHE
jgi:glycosyltransferase involved in cell wall biosynthesis